MGNQKTNGKPGRTGERAAAALFAALLGSGGGYALAGDIWGDAGSLFGAAAGALALILVETAIEAKRRRGQPRTLQQKILPDFFFGAILGWLMGAILPGRSPVLYGLILGTVAGLLGLKLILLMLAIATGALGGLLGWLVDPALPASLLGALVLPVFRLLRAGIIREEEPVRLVGERIPPERAGFVVPFEANSKYVGSNYMQVLARETDGAFKRNLPGIGLIDNLDVLQGPHCDPTRVNPLIHDFYEHTSRYTLTIVPGWDLRYKPLFWAFKRYVARPMGQANLPFNTEETQRGVVSYIDTIDFECDDIIDLRGWIRAYRESQEAIYVGIYTTTRQAGAGYVSVGFPLPGANFTATLLPYNHAGDQLLLKTHGTGMEFPGHYLTTIDRETGGLNVLKLPTFAEEIHVYVKDGQLRTDHRFFLSGLNFLTLYYTIELSERLPG